jgi:predicted metalloprotease with PDZ domain
MTIRVLAVAATIAALVVVPFDRRAAVAEPPLRLLVDATHAPQGYFDVHETLAVSPGPLTLVYPRWIPGHHAPNGPIPNVVDIKLSAGGATVPWERDPVDMYAFHATVPAGATSLAVDFRYLANALRGYDGGPTTTPSLMALEWWKVVLSPQAADYGTVVIAPSITLPAGWSSATALEASSTSGDTVTFKPVSLEMLADSPLDAGRYAKVVPLGTWDGAPLELAIFADVPSSLAIGDKTLASLRAIVTQMHALYVHRHFNHYTFLLTLTDVFGNGLEHHQSSDNGASPDFFTSPSALTAGASLLTHEFNHSWDGKFR